MQNFITYWLLRNCICHVAFLVDCNLLIYNEMNDLNSYEVSLANNFVALAALDDAVVWLCRAGLFMRRGLSGVASSSTAPCRCRGGVGRGWWCALCPWAWTGVVGLWALDNSWFWLSLDSSVDHLPSSLNRYVHWYLLLRWRSPLGWER